MTHKQQKDSYQKVLELLLKLSQMSRQIHDVFSDESLILGEYRKVDEKTSSVQERWYLMINSQGLYRTCAEKHGNLAQNPFVPANMEKITSVDIDLIKDYNVDPKNIQELIDTLEA